MSHQVATTPIDCCGTIRNDVSNIRQRFMYCDDCCKVVRVDLPECIHFGAYQLGKNAESVMVVFRSKDGKVSVPWDSSTPCPKGYVREEVRGARAVRRLEKELDARDLKRHQHFKEQKERLFGPRRQRSREDLKQIIRDGVATKVDRDGHVQTIRVTQYGRDLARAALQRMDGGYTENYSANNYRRE